MKLSKTEAAILATVNTKGRFCGSMYGGQGGQGGKISSGHREYSACGGLVKKGLVRFIRTDNSRIYRNGYSVHCYDVLIGKLEA